IPVSAAAGTAYRMRVVASAPATTGAQSNAFTVTIPAATPNLTYNGLQLSASGTGTFVWFRNGNTIAGASTNTYIPTQTGNYTVGIENNGCSPSMSTAVSVDAGFSTLQAAANSYCENSSLELSFTS